MNIRGRAKVELHVNTSQMQEKEVAMNTLHQFVEDLGLHLSEYILDIFDLCTRSLVSPTSPSIKILGLTMIPKLVRLVFRSLRKQFMVQTRETNNLSSTSNTTFIWNITTIQNIYKEVFAVLLPFIDRKDQTSESMMADQLDVHFSSFETLLSTLDLLTEFSDVLSQEENNNTFSFLSEEEVSILVPLLQKAALGSITRRLLLQQELEDEETGNVDEDDFQLLEQTSNMEKELLVMIGECFSKASRIFGGENMLPFYEEFFDMSCRAMIKSDNSIDLLPLTNCFQHLLKFTVTVLLSYADPPLV